MLVATAMVQLMTPGVAFFYGGLSNEASVVTTMMLSFGTMAIVTILWCVIGFSLAFAPNLAQNGIIGNYQYAPLDLVTPGSMAAYPLMPSISTHIFAMYQLCFAIVTSAIISGSMVGKIKCAWRPLEPKGRSGGR